MAVLLDVHVWKTLAFTISICLNKHHYKGSLREKMICKAMVSLDIVVVTITTVLIRHPTQNFPGSFAGNNEATKFANVFLLKVVCYMVVILVGKRTSESFASMVKFIKSFCANTVG